MAEKVILEVDVTGVTQSLLDARATLQGYKLALEDAIATNGKYSKEAEIAKAMVDSQNKSVKQLEGQLTRIVQVQEATNESLQDLMKNGYEPANKTVDQNRKVLNALTAEYNKASKEQREKLAPAIKSVSDELKKQEGAIGDTRRNVGNYQEAFVGAFSEISKGVPVLGQLRTAQQGVNAIMSANPIGGVVTLLTALFQIMQSNAEVADQVSFAFAGVNKFFGNIIDTVVDTVSSFDKLTAALKNPIDFIFNLGKNAATAAKEGYQAAQAFDDLTEKQAELTGLADISRSKAEGLAKTLKDRTKSEQERIKIAEQVANLEIDALNKLQQAKEAELKATNLQNKDRKLSGEERAHVIKLQLELEQLTEEKNTAEKLKQTRINILLDKQVTEAKKKETKSREEIERERQEQVRKTFDNERTVRAAEIELLDDGLDKRLRAFDLAFEKEEEQLRKAGATEALITELRNKKVAEIEAQYSQKKQQQDEAFITNRQAMYDKAQQDMIDAAEEAAKQVAQRDTQTFSNILNNIASIFGQAASYIEQFAQQNTEALERQYEQGLITEQQFNSQTKELKLKAFKEAKALKVTEAIITTATSTLNAFNSGLQLGGPLGMVIGAVFAAAAAALGATQIAFISRQQPPKYAEGGQVFNVGGKSHAEGGTLYRGSDGNTFEVERGEKIFVMKANASRHIDALGGLNMAFGGRSWSDSPIRYAADGGMIQDGGFAIRQTSERASDMAMLKQFAKSIAEEIPTPVVSVTEINKVNKSRNRSIKTSEL